MKIYIQAQEDGTITTWGEEALPGATEVVAPADWFEFSVAKYMLSGNSLVVRDGWVDPVAEPEVPVEPEA